MKIRYWIPNYRCNKKILSEPREDGRVLVEDSLIKFIYKEVYGNKAQYSQAELSRQTFILGVVDILAETNILTVERLRNLLAFTHHVANPDSHHPLMYTIIQEIVKEPTDSQS